MPRYDIELEFKCKVKTEVEDSEAVDIKVAKYLLEEDLKDWLRMSEWQTEEVQVLNFKKDLVKEEPPVTVRDLAIDHPLMYKFDYRDTSRRDYADLEEVLEFIGYELVDNSIVGEYADIKGYFDCEVRTI